MTAPGSKADGVDSFFRHDAILAKKDIDHAE
jgi:hypothetical protein